MAKEIKKNELNNKDFALKMSDKLLKGMSILSKMDTGVANNLLDTTKTSINNITNSIDEMTRLRQIETIATAQIEKEIQITQRHKNSLIKELEDFKISIEKEYTERDKQYQNFYKRYDEAKTIEEKKIISEWILAQIKQNPRNRIKNSNDNDDFMIEI